MKNILICYDCGFGPSKYEDFATEFCNNGHNVLVVSLDKKNTNDKYILRKIISFEPNLTFSFNNVISKELLDKLNCPVAVIDADSPSTFINRENLEHPNVYYFGCQSVSDKIYEKIPNFSFNKEKYLYLSFTATNFQKNNDLKQEIQVSFLGSNVMSYHQEITKNYNHKQIINLIKNNDGWESDCEEYNDIKHNFNAQKRLKYLSQLTDLGLQIYGNHTWQDVFKQDIELAKCYIEQDILDPKSAENLYNRSKISINIDHDQADTSFSFRVPDIMASNACLLTSYKKDFEDLFGKYISQEVKEAIIYKNQYDMRQKCIALLNDEELRLRCVKECQNAIEQNGRWKYRLKRIEDFLDINLINNHSNQGIIEHIPKQIKQPQGYLKINLLPQGYLKINLLKRFYYGLFILLHNTLPFSRISALQKKNIKYLNKLLNRKIKPRKRKFSESFQSIKKEIFYYIKKEICYYKRFKNKNLPIKVVFLVHVPSSWDVFSSIYEECLSDELFDPYVISIPRRQYGQYKDFRYNDENYNFFQEKGIKAIKGFDEVSGVCFDLESLNPDVVFVQTPYDSQRQDIYAINNLNRFTRVCYLQYAFIITSGSFEPNFYNTKFHKKCWRLFAETAYHKNLYKKYNSSHISRKVIISGYPKFDAYKRNLGHEHSLWNISKNINPKIKRVIWCPHWTIGSVYDSSNFLQYYKYFLRFSEKNQDIDLVIRPHPLLFDELLSKKHLSQNELDIYLERVAELPNAKIDNNFDYFDLFRTSDMLISDNSSFLAEYLPTGNPIIYTHHYENNSVNLNDYGVKLTKYHYVAKNEFELDQLINRVLIKGDDYNRDKRVSNTKEHMSFIDSHSGLFIKNYLKESFGF